MCSGTYVYLHVIYCKVVFILLQLTQTFFGTDLSKDLNFLDFLKKLDNTCVVAS